MLSRRRKRNGCAQGASRSKVASFCIHGLALDIGQINLSAVGRSSLQHFLNFLTGYSFAVRHLSEIATSQDLEKVGNDEASRVGT